MMQVCDLRKEREAKSGIDREMLHVNADLQYSVSSTGMFKVRNAWERSYAGDRIGQAILSH